jgi:hypothetical protein
MCYTGARNRKKGEPKMQKLNQFWMQYGTPRNLRVLYVLLTLIALAVAGGAPSIGSGVH